MILSTNVLVAAVFLRPHPQPTAPKPAPAGRLLYRGDMLQRRVTSTFLAHFPHPNLPPTQFSRERSELGEAATGEGRSPARRACALRGGRTASPLPACSAGGSRVPPAHTSWVRGRAGQPQPSGSCLHPAATGAYEIETEPHTPLR